MDYFLFSLLLISLGIIFGFISSTPLGPINLLVAENYFSSKKIKVLPFLSGVILIDAIFAYLALYGIEKVKLLLDNDNFKFIEDYNIFYYLNLIGAFCIFFIGLIIGVRILGEEKEVCDNPKFHQRLNKTNGLAFFKGMFLCGSNPGFVAYWLSISGTLKAVAFQLFPEFIITDIYRVFISLGIVFGDILWFGLFIYLLKKGSKKLNGNILVYIRSAIAIILIIMGILFFYHSL